jgi:hypothetical protein
MGRVLLVAACLLGGCCGAAAQTMLCPDPSGGDGGVGVSLATPALECTSKLCLIARRNPGSTVALCTRECSSDDDCESMAGAYCKVGYGCGRIGAYPNAVCICRDQLDGGS